IRGAREHNLQAVDVALPHHALIVITGVSGSGKSSLAFDTICREGQRRYLESFSSHARQFLGKLGRPAVDHISGLSPTLSIDQKTVVRNPRSTLGTLTELYDFLRLLFGKLGVAHCPECGALLAALSPERISEALLKRFAGEEILLLAPIVEGHRGQYRRELERLRRDGFSEVRIDGELLPTDPTPIPESQKVHEIEVVVGHITMSVGNHDTLLRGIEQSLRIGGRVLKVLCNERIERFSSANTCPQCGAGFPEIGPRLFSFNSQYGACPSCRGLGVQDRIAPELLIADPGRTLRQGALALTTDSGYIVYSQVTLDILNQVCQAHGFSVDIPWSELTKEQQQVVLHGSDRIMIPFGKHPLESRMKWSGITPKPREEGYYKGIVPIMEEILKRHRNKNILRFARSVPCGACQGTRLRKEALSVTFEGHTISDIDAMSLDALASFLDRLHFAPSDAPIGGPIVREMQKRTILLQQLGLGHLTLNRRSTTLSGGEAQRVRLATQAGTRLRGILYVLDEPSIGLHPRDNRRLLEILALLRDNGNTVLVVEHDENTIRSADWLVDMGPGAGDKGGRILFSGKAGDLLSTDSLRMSRTRAYVSGESQIPIPAKRRPGNGRFLEVLGASEHNLKGIDVSFRLGAFNVVTGVSGSGKSTLIEGILARSLRRSLHGASVQPGRHVGIRGAEFIDKIIDIDQFPIGRTPRSNPATYTNLFDHVRALFASLPESKQRGWKKGRFSINVKGGRCEACQGAGVQVIGMHFMGDVDVVCEECGGRRFNEDTLTIHHKGKSILDVLELPVEEAYRFFADQPKMARILCAMRDVGLGYLSLGQPSTTLSGGEAQRIKLASELGRPSTGKTLYILDEPTTGLHLADIEILLDALNRLVDSGNTVIAVEHNLEFVKVADWVIDLGPEGGDCGGKLVAAGTPEAISAVEASHTGAALRARGWQGIESAPCQLRSTPKAPSKRHTEPYSARTIESPGTTHYTAHTPHADYTPPPIRLGGISTHNLKGIDVSIPANRITVITGVSGSGKSSLAFDTIFAEGQRRFRESLPTFARRFLGRSAEAQIEEASGLTPTIAISQRVASRNPRSTVGTITEIYEYYRLLYARAGRAHCPDCESLMARMFSFNHHQGACPSCKGLGVITVCDPDRLITDPNRSLFEGAISGHKTGRYYGDPKGQHLAILTAVEADCGIDLHVPWKQLDARARKIAMYGTGEKAYQVTWHFKREKREGQYTWETTWRGFSHYVNEEYERKHADHRGEAMRGVMKDEVCPECHGERLNRAARCVRFAGLNIAALSSMSIAATLRMLSALEAEPADHGVDHRQLSVTAEIRQEVAKRLQSLVDVGLGYLSLDRSAATLSGGEAQRVRLATQLGSGLCGVTYVLDEPTIGLHACDTQRLIKTLKGLCAAENTVVVVEHDASVIRAADYVIDLGPGGGRHGGRIVAEGSVDAIMDNPASRTGYYLREESAIPVSERRRCLGEGITITRASANNLHGFDIEIPSGGIIAITGVSGSGKSSLIFDVLMASCDRGAPVGCAGLEGMERFRRVLSLDQTPIGSTPASNPATYSGIFDHIRGLFAETDCAQARGYRKARFSFNTRGGRCERCQGMGRIKVSMDFLADIWIRCEECHGKRYNEETLECTYHGASIADVLEMTVSEALGVFGDTDGVVQPLLILEEVGLGYLRLGQPATTLSGGESQRLKLVTELIGGKDAPLSRSQNAGCRRGGVSRPVGRGITDRGGCAEKAALGNLYLFDEPTTGLHFDDTVRLLSVFDRLVDGGHTVIVIEHHPDVVKRADWVIDLGPEGGDGGGTVVARGTPETLATIKSSHTGQMLREVLGKRRHLDHT
ncbi:MAG: excinuclease ABC subunit UvrA, partial [Candidatus Eisenbacteria sp.]|nr:excinuclease ABC subunit UvrA [Candidatus Eisenbacteria bacterium]